MQSKLIIENKRIYRLYEDGTKKRVTYNGHIKFNTQIGVDKYRKEQRKNK